MNMATFEEKPLVQDDRDFYEHEEEGSGCGCFRVSGFRRWQRQRHEDEGGEGWAMNKLRKMKEVSEVIAGPKWKTFIRKINGRKQKYRFQYDEHSYALNFSSGANSEDEDEDMPPSFSTMFTAPRRPTEL